MPESQDSPLPFNVPEDINTELQQCMHYHIGLSKAVLYALGDFTEADLKTVCAEIQDTYSRNILRNPSDAMEFLCPARNWAALTHLNMRDLVRYHVLEFDKGWKDSAGNNQGDLDWYPFGFAVLVSRDWCRDGVVLVHCDDAHDDGKFRADSCVLPVDEMGLSFTSLLFGDEEFAEIKALAPGLWEWEDREETSD